MSQEADYAHGELVAAEDIEYSWAVCVILSGEIILKSKVS